MPKLTNGVRNILYINIFFLIFSLIFEEFTFKYLALHIYDSPNFFAWQFISHQFIHGGIVHLLLNMMGLIYLGTIVERYYGTIRFYVLYIIMGICSGLLQTYTQSSDIPLVGASGAIFGIFALFTMTNWNRPIQIMFIPYNIKTKYVFMGYMLLEVCLALFTTSFIGHFAHIGGALSGILIHIFYHYEKVKLGVLQSIKN